MKITCSAPRPVTRTLPRLAMRGVAKTFGPTRALDGVDLEVAPGEVLALIGENGAGKSTLMKVLAGVHAPDAGELLLDGAPFAPQGPLAARRAGVAMIHQELSIASHLTVAENIVLGVEPRLGPFLDLAAIRATATAALRAVGLEHLPLDRLAADLSIAERQLLEIGRAVAGGCRVLVLDEPTSSLTRADISRLFALVARLRSEGQAIIYISHFLEEVKTVSDRYVVLRDGRTVGSGLTADATPAHLVALMVGRDVRDLYPRSPRPRGELLLACDSLAGARAPVSASLRLHRGEVVGIAGLVGAGRTEFLRALFGLDPVREGTVRLAAFTGPASPAARWSQGAGLVSEDRKAEGLALDLPIAENLTLSSLPLWIRPAAQACASQKWITELGVKCASPWQPVGALSGGNQQKVALGRLLHHGVDLLLLDEPTRGIDIGAKATLYRHIDRLALEGKAVLVVSSYLPELLGICDRVAVMCRGVLGPARPVSETDEHRIMHEATGGDLPT